MIIFDSVSLKKHLKRALSCVSNVRDSWSCIMFDGENGKIVATDGFVMYIGEIAFFPGRFLIHYEELKQIEKQLNFKDHFNVELNENTFSYLNFSIQIKNKIDKIPYPKYLEIIGLETQHGRIISERTFDTKIFSRVLSSLNHSCFVLRFCPQPDKSLNISPCYININDEKAPGMFVVMPMED